MRKILGLISSPRKNGNCEIMAKEILYNMGDGNELQIIRLLDLDIKPCKACYSCMKPGRKCPGNDDMEFLLKTISEADGIIICSPVYNWGSNTGIRRILDRAFLFKDWRDRFAGKPCVTFVTYGIPYEEGYGLGELNVLARLLNLNLRDSASFLGAWPGDVLRHKRNLEMARQLGEALVNPFYKRKNNDFECPNCFNNIIKFRAESESRSSDLRTIGKVECAFCGTVAEVRTSDRGLEITYQGKGLYSEDFPDRLSSWHRESIRLFNEEKKNFESWIGKYKDMNINLYPFGKKV